MNSWKIKVVNIYDCEVKFYLSLKQACRYISSVKYGVVYMFIPDSSYGDYSGTWDIAWFVKNGVMLNKEGVEYFDC